MKYFYRVYGLHIASDIELEELMLDDENADADIEIVHGYIPDESISNPIMVGENEGILCYTADTFYFKINGVAEYFIEKGRIGVRECEGADYRRVKAFLYGTSIGLCAFLMNKILIHGSGLTRKGMGVVVTGKSGSGKSTTAALLRQRGYVFLADDICGVFSGENNAYIEPGYPYVKLCGDAITDRSKDMDRWKYIDGKRDKYQLRLPDEEISQEAQQFRFLFELVPTEASEVSVTKLQSMDKIAAIIDNIFRIEYIRNMWKIEPLFSKKIIILANKIEMYRICRPVGEDTVDVVVGEIEKIVGNIRGDKS